MSVEKQVVPSVVWLSETQLNYMNDALLVHETFNLAQMLQGENVPANITELYNLVHEQGQEWLPFLHAVSVGLHEWHCCGQWLPLHEC